MSNPRTFNLLASAARTATPTDVSLVNNRASGGYKGIRIIVDVTSVTSTPSVVVTLRGYNADLAKYYDVLVGTAITDVTGTGTYVLKVFPGATPASGGVANDVLPGTWHLTVVHGNSNSITYSVNVELFDV